MQGIRCLVTGATGFLGAHLLDQRRSAVTMQFTKKLLGFALGRGVMLSDKPLLLAITAKDRTAAEVVEMVVRSRQFREIRGINHGTQASLKN